MYVELPLITGIVELLLITGHAGITTYLVSSVTGSVELPLIILCNAELPLITGIIKLPQITARVLLNYR